MREEIIGDCRLILGDCLEILPTLGKVDAVVTDPPFEKFMHDFKSLAAKRELRTDGGPAIQDLNFGAIDDLRGPLLNWIKNNNHGWLIAFCAAEGVYLWRQEILGRGIKFKTPCIWVKPDCTPKLNGQRPAMGYESFVTAWCGEGYAKWNAGGKRGVYTHNTNQPERTGLHPTEKPVPLMAEILRDFTNVNETILDPFMGSGTTGVACAKMGRKFIGIELDEKYFELSCKRIEEAYKQGDFFVEQPKVIQEKLI